MFGKTFVPKYSDFKISGCFVITLLALALLPNVLSNALADPSPLPVNPNWHALGGSFTIPNNAPFIVDPLGNDDLPTSSDTAFPDTVVIVTGPLHGSAVFNPDTTVTYAPDPNFAAPFDDSFTYQDCSSVQCSDIGTFTFHVTSSNNPPVAQDFSFSVNQGSSASIPIQGSDPEGNTFWITSFSGASHGSLVLDPTDLTNKTLVYTPTITLPLYSGPDSFTYQLSDGIGGHGNVATVSVTITLPTPPTVAITQPADGSTLDHISSINGTASDNTSVSSVKVSVDGEAPQTATYSAGTWTLAVSLANGDHTANATATDSVGLATQTPVTHFTIGSTQQPTKGEVSGDGDIGKKTHFKIDVESKDGKKFKGKLDFSDKTGHIDLDSKNITFLSVDSTHTHATINGNGKLKDNSAVTFQILVTDPKTKGIIDTFSIKIMDSTDSTIYSNSGNVRGHIEIGNDKDNDHHHK